MATILADLLVKIGADTDDLKGGMDKAAKAVDKNIKKITAAGVGLGIAFEGFARQQGENNQVLGRTAVLTGETTDSLRDLAVQHSDTTTSASDNAGAMERLTKSGFDTREEFDELLPSINNVATATGQDLVASIDRSEKLLGPLGMGLEDVEDQADSLSNTTAHLSEKQMGTLERNLPRVADELQELELTLDDTTAGVKAFEDQGVEGQEAVREFRRAVADSEGDMDTFLENIGLTADEWEEYQEEFAPIPGLTDELTDAHNEAITPMQKMQQWAENLLFEYGHLAEMAGILAPVLLALGPALKIVTAAKWLFNAALWASPITWIILAFVALIAIIVLVIYYWDEIAEATVNAWDWIVDTLSNAWDWIVGIFSSAWDWIVDTATSTWNWVSGIFKTAWGWITGTVDRGVDTVMGIIDWFGELPGRVGGWFEDMYNRAKDWIGDLIDRAKEIPDDIMKGLGDLGSLLWDVGEDIIQGLIDGVENMISSVTDTFSGITDMIPDWKGPEKVDLRLLGPAGEDLMTGLSEGIMHGSDDVRKTLRDITTDIPGVVGSVSYSGRSSSSQIVRFDVTGADEEFKRMIRKMVRVNGGGDPHKAFGR